MCPVPHGPASPEGGNPFSASRFAPGALPFRFPRGQSFAELLRRWQNAGRRGAVVGPHGSGKSTLLAGLVPILERDGRRVLFVELHEGAKNLPFCDPSFRDAGTEDDLFVDGYEQLSYLSRLRLWSFARRRRCGLLVTSHRETGFPTLVRTEVDPQLAKALVAELASAEWRDRYGPQIDRAFGAHNGNLREVFFDLYDLFECRRGSSDRLGGPS